MTEFCAKYWKAGSPKLKRISNKISYCKPLTVKNNKKKKSKLRFPYSLAFLIDHCILTGKKLGVYLFKIE